MPDHNGRRGFVKQGGGGQIINRGRACINPHIQNQLKLSCPPESDRQNFDSNQGHE